MTKKTTSKKTISVAEAKEKLINSILNEKRTFDMGQFTTEDFDVEDKKPATCGTASCMAGHIEALWPSVAKRLAKEQLKEQEQKEPFACIDHEVLAADVWKEVTGKPCRFDFIGDTYRHEDEDGGIDAWWHATREQAVAHIKGRSKNWPLLRGPRQWNT
jgi:hypothetical protein